MTRRDFAVLNDPFLDSPTSATQGEARIAATAEAPAADGSAGYARVGSTQAAAASPATSPATSAANAFQIASRSRTVVPESTTSGLARIAAGQPATSNVTSASSPEPKPMDMAEMSAFIKKQAEASGLTETAADLEADFAAFAAARQEEWKKNVQQVKEQASSQVRQVADQGIAFGEAAMPSIPDMAFGDGFGSTERAQPLIQQMSGQSSGAATQPVKEMPNPFVDQAAAGTEQNPFAELQADENPFGFQPPVTSADRQVQNSGLSQTEPRSNPGQSFEDFASSAESKLTGKIESKPAPQPESNPFEQWQKQPQKMATQSTQQAKPVSQPRTATAPAAKQDKLDDKFGFDVGWRPANMERP